MAAKIAGASKTKTSLFLIAGIVFGPILMLIGLHYPLIVAVKRPDWLDYGVAILGTFILILALSMLSANQQRLEWRMEELERLKN